LLYVDKYGHVIKCLLRLLHVNDISTTILKATIDVMFAIHRLSISKLRRQGYDGARLVGECNELKDFILNENLPAYYFHCFAYQLQLALVVESS